MEKNILVMFVWISKYLCGDDSSKMCKIHIMTEDYQSAILNSSIITVLIGILSIVLDWRMEP